MKFEEILPHLKAGCKVTRIEWQESSHLKPHVTLAHNHTFYAVPESDNYSTQVYRPSSTDLLAEDWILYNGGEE